MKLFQLHNSSSTVVLLSSVQLSSSGIYRCDVSGEAPSFQTVTEHREMMVVGELTASFLFSTVLLIIMLRASVVCLREPL